MEERKKQTEPEACKVAKKIAEDASIRECHNKEQLKKKQKMVNALLSKYGKVEPIIGMENPYYYRNKVHAVFDRDRKGNIVSGTYETKTHRIVPVENCLIEDKKSQEIIRTIRGLLKSFKIKTYDEDTGYGLFRHVLIRRGFKSGEIMVVLVLGSPILPSSNNFVKALRKEHPEITTVVLNINDRKTSMILGEREKVLYGKGFIRDELCGCTFRISPKSFYQVNPVQTEILYQKAIEFAHLTGKESVIDAYCGIGTIGLIASGHAKEVVGVELNKDAVKDAILNAKENQIRNVRFFQGDAGEFMEAMAAEGNSMDVLFMDPPRAGSDEKFMASAVKMGPEKIVYISCNPETLARDLKYLTKKGYQVKNDTAGGMLRYRHVETVCLLSKLHEAKHHVNVRLDMDELDLTSAESKATYEEIKAHVAEHNDGMKVSNLYIAQVKAKYGIIERENYNKPKSDDSRQPKCPKEKEEAIVEALKAFKMIWFRSMMI